MNEYRYCTLRELPGLKDEAAEWFHSKWGVPKEAYLDCMTAYLDHETEFGWYLCLENGRILMWQLNIATLILDFKAVLLAAARQPQNMAKLLRQLFNCRSNNRRDGSYRK